MKYVFITISVNSCTKLHRIQLQFNTVLVGVERDEGMDGCQFFSLSQPASTNLSLKVCLNRHGKVLAPSKNAFKNYFMFWALPRMPNKPRCF